jgi:hypothetical protein
VIHLEQTIETIRSASGAIHDNNLESLRACRAR